MSAAMAEARIKGDRKPRINLCGDCGCPLPATELLCTDCRQSILIQDTEGDTHERMRVAFPTEAQAEAFIQGIDFLDDDHVETEGPEADIDSEGGVEYAVFVRRFA
jgi:hypothetical protein